MVLHGLCHCKNGDWSFLKIYINSLLRANASKGGILKIKRINSGDKLALNTQINYSKQMYW